MKSSEAREAAGIAIRFAAAVLSTVPGGGGVDGAALRRACATLSATAEMLAKAGTLAAAMGDAVALARAAGAGLVAMGRVRLVLLAERPVTAAGAAIVQAGIHLSLAAEARILGATTFRSRQDIDAAGDRMHAAFADAEIVAADARDAATYRAIVTLHAAVTRHLAEAARPLPRLVVYALPSVRPAPVLAYAAYADATRFAELIAENKVVHPAFLPRDGRMLSD